MDGRLDWKELGRGLLSRNAGNMAQGRLFKETEKEVSLSRK